MSNWEVVLAELETVPCLFCKTKLALRWSNPDAKDDQKGYPIFDCPNQELHENAGFVWAWYANDDFAKGIYAINVIVKGWQFCFRPEGAHFQRRIGSITDPTPPLPASITLKNILEKADSLVKTLLIFG